MSAVPKLPPELQLKPPSSAATSLDRRIRMLRTAMGPLIAAALEDPDVVEIMLNPDGSLWIDRLSSGRSPTGVKLSEADGERIIRLVAAHVGTEVHRGQPLLTAELPAWMLLHFTLVQEKETRYWSPQVISESLRQKLREISVLPPPEQERAHERRDLP